jgi:hypothetical protein
MPISKLAWVASTVTALIPWSCSLLIAKNAQANSRALAIAAIAPLPEALPQAIAKTNLRMLAPLVGSQTALSGHSLLAQSVSQGLAIREESQLVAEPLAPNLISAHQGMLTSLASPLAKDLREQDLIKRNLTSFNSLLAMLPHGDGASTSQSALKDRFAKVLPMVKPLQSFFHTLSATSSFFSIAWGPQEGKDGFSQRQRRENILQNHYLQASGWHCLVPLKQLEQQPRSAAFPVWIRGCWMAGLTDRTLAQRMGDRLNDALLSADVATLPLTVSRENGQPVVRLGKAVLFTVTPELAKIYDRHSDELAVQWLNNVRQVLGRPPMTIDQVQTQMYGLDDTGNTLDGTASWYGPYFHGRQTANGEIYDQGDLTAAHRTLPLGTFLRVTNRKNGRSVVVRINDRGPYIDEEEYRIVDLSHRAAKVLDSEEKGVVPIEAVVLSPVPGGAADLTYGEGGFTVAKL